MSFPESLTTRVVKGRFVTHPDGIPAAGTVRIALRDYMQGPSDDLFVVPFEVEMKLDANGAFSVLLPCTDDPDWTPSSYKISVTTINTNNAEENKVTANDVKVLRHSLVLSHHETGPVDLADVVNIPPITPGESYVLATSRGVPGGVATLDEEGIVLLGQLPESLFSDVSWDDITDKPTAFPPSSSFSTVHVQTTPSTSWGIAHSFGREPNVLVVIDGEHVMADVKYLSETTVGINFGEPQIGKAVLT